MLDLFAGGGGGWDLAARSLGLPSVGIEWDGPACATRAVVGLPTIRADVSTYPAEVFAGKVEGLCGGPPCQSFSSAGKGKGLADPRGQMVYEPMRYVRACRPRWVALEQVPEVLGYWRWIARELATMGYSTWAGILNAADYGVPQIRKRAILLASLDRQAQPPAPTHSKTGAGDLFGVTLPRWVTMAEALGWGLTERPAYTLCGDGGRKGGGHHDGGSRQREEIAKHKAAGKWLPPGQGPGGGGAGPRGLVPSSGSVPPVTGPCKRDNHTLCHEPWCQCDCHETYRRSTVLRSPGRSYGASPRRAEAATELAPTVALAHNASSWCWERPATTITVGHSRVEAPGPERENHSQSSNAVPVEPWELGVLQGFPADHPWQAPRVSAQIGNAIPPPLALACLSAVTGRRVEDAA